jgi:hypothetical protein
MEIPIEYKDQIIMIKRDRGEHDNYFFDKAYYIAEKIHDKLIQPNDLVEIKKDYDNLYKVIENDAKQMCNEKYLLCKY